MEVTDRDVQSEREDGTHAALAASYAFVNPIIALLLGVGLGSETVTLREWLAAGIVVLGVILLVVVRYPDRLSPTKETDR